MTAWEANRRLRGPPSHMYLEHHPGSVRATKLRGARRLFWLSSRRLWRRKSWVDHRKVRVSAEEVQCNLVYCLSQRVWGGCKPVVAGLAVAPHSKCEGKEPTLLFEYSNLTPLPVLVCVIVLYSPSSSSLSA